MIYHNRTVNRDFVLEEIGEEAIYERFLGLKPTTGTFYTNPLRSDKSAGCTFYRSRKSGKLRFIDYSRGWDWDVFDVVQLKYNCNMSQAIKIIVDEFGFYDKETTHERKEVAEFVEPKKKDLLIKRRKWQQNDLDLWATFYIDLETLTIGKVDPILVIWLGDRVVYKYNVNDRCYVYNFYRGKIKCYFPDRTKDEMRFLQSPGLLVQGWHLLPKTGKLCIITSSYKDVLFLYRLGYASIAPISENTILPDAGIQQLKQRFENVVLFYNNDEAGKESMVKHSAIYDVDYVYIPEDYPKDPTDFYKEEGLESSIDMLQELFKDYL